VDQVMDAGDAVVAFIATAGIFYAASRLVAG
jgi:hypothetical protein